MGAERLRRPSVGRKQQESPSKGPGVKRSRAPNGQARNPSYLLTFDPDDEAEQRAWSVMQRLAAQRRAKPVLIGFLMALSEIESRTNQRYSVEDMMAMFVTSVVSGQRGGLA